MNMVFICGLNLSGKGLLLQLLDGHEALRVYPFHKFSISGVLSSYYTFLKETQYTHVHTEFLSDSRYTVNLATESATDVRKISISQLIDFFLRINSSVPHLLQAHFSQRAPQFAGDTTYAFGPFPFSFSEFIDQLEQLFFIQQNIVHSLFKNFH